jgi:hypothetical protein
MARSTSGLNGAGSVEHQTTNLGVRSSNLFGRANKIRHFSQSHVPRSTLGRHQGYISPGEPAGAFSDRGCGLTCQSQKPHGRLRLTRRGMRGETAESRRGNRGLSPSSLEAGAHHHRPAGALKESVPHHVCSRGRSPKCPQLRIARKGYHAVAALAARGRMAVWRG